MFDSIVNCGNCLCFRDSGVKPPIGQPQPGLCHRYPPSVVIVPTAVQMHGRAPESKAASSFPPTVETNGCMEFKPNAKAADAINEAKLKMQ